MGFRVDADALGGGRNPQAADEFRHAADVTGTRRTAEVYQSGRA